MLGIVVALAQEYTAAAQAILDTARTADPAAGPLKATPLLPLLKVGRSPGCCGLGKTADVLLRSLHPSLAVSRTFLSTCTQKGTDSHAPGWLVLAALLTVLRCGAVCCGVQSVAVCEVALPGVLPGVLAAMHALTWRAKAARALDGATPPAPRTLARLLKEVSPASVTLPTLLALSDSAEGEPRMAERPRV